MIASIVVPLQGLVVEVTIIPIQRGVGPTIDYGVTIWQVSKELSGTVRKVIVGGDSLLPPYLFSNAILKLWESI